MMNSEKRRIEFSPAYDHREKGGGIHGVDMYWYVTGPLGAIQFVVYTNWQLPHVQADMDAKQPDSRFPYMFHEPMPADLGYHSYKPMYEGQTLCQEDCHLLHAPCYYDGSTLNAERIMDVLRREGSDGVWRELEAYYHETFAAKEAA